MGVPRMRAIVFVSSAVLSLILGIAGLADAQQNQQNEKQDQQRQQKAPERAKPEQHAQQQQEQNREQHDRDRQQQVEQEQYRQQRAQQQYAQQRTQEQRRVEQSTWQDRRARNWESDHRSWHQRGGYNDYRIPDDRYRGYFGSQHTFRIYSLPFMDYRGYPRFQYEGYWITLLDPWPENWSNDWYDNDDVYIAYWNDGYYLFNRRYPGVGIAVSISM